MRLTVRTQRLFLPETFTMALDGALHDWLGKYCGQPLWRMFGHDPVTPPTSYTVGIGSVADSAAKVGQPWERSMCLHITCNACSL